MQSGYRHILFCAASLLSFFLLTGAKCNKETDECHHKIYLINNSNKTIYVTVPVKYPDTTIQDPNPYEAGDYYKIPANTKGNAMQQRGCIEAQFDLTFRAGKAIIFIFEADIFQSNSWEAIKQNGLYSKRYILSLDDLKAMNFTINYP